MNIFPLKWSWWVREEQPSPIRVIGINRAALPASRGFLGDGEGFGKPRPEEAGRVIHRQLLSTVRAKPGGRGLLMGPVTRRELWESLAHFTVSVSWRHAQKGVGTLPLTPRV